MAANLAFLGWDAGVAGLIGRDPAARLLIEDLAGCGVETSLLQSVDGVETPVVVHEIQEDRHRFHFKCPKCGRKFPKVRPLPPAAAEELVGTVEFPDVFFFDRASASAILLASLVRRAGRLVVFEPSTKGHAGLFARAIELAHVVKYSAERVPAFRDRLPEPVGSQVRIVTQGPQGVLVRLPSGEDEHQDSFTGPVLDSAGAGDWTTAGFLAGLSRTAPAELADHDVLAAVKFGQLLALANCAYPGARGLAEHNGLDAVLGWTASMQKKSVSSANTELSAPGLAAASGPPPVAAMAESARCQACVAV